MSPRDHHAVMTVPGQAFHPGDRCGQYEIRALIGNGGIGEVYQAEQSSIGRQVAIKCLQFRHADRGDLRARMEMEGRALGKINHPSMVTVFDAGCTDDGVVWIAMELLQGCTLREVLTDRGRLPPNEAVACAIDVGEAVAAAHRERIIHRDLKPENIFVTEAGAIKVLDLGTMKLQGWGELKTTERGRVVGTPAYMSPEHIRSVRIDARSDIYALGMVLYEMLAKHPFLHLTTPNDYQEMARLQLFAAPRRLRELVPELPKALDRAVLRALAKNPEDRPQRMEEFVALLREAMGIEAPGARVSLRPRPEHSPGPPPANGSPFGPHGTVRIDAPSPAAPVADAKPTDPLSSSAGPISSPADPNTSDPVWVPSEDTPFARPGARVVGWSNREVPRWLLGGLALGLVAGGFAVWMDRSSRSDDSPPTAASAAASVANSSSPPEHSAAPLASMASPTPTADASTPAPSALAMPEVRPTVPASPRAPTATPTATSGGRARNPDEPRVPAPKDPATECPGRLDCAPMPDPIGMPPGRMPKSGLE
jgi:serine/threonine-protein kinase